MTPPKVARVVPSRLTLSTSGRTAEVTLIGIYLAQIDTARVLAPGMRTADDTSPVTAEILHKSERRVLVRLKALPDAPASSSYRLVIEGNDQKVLTPLRLEVIAPKALRPDTHRAPSATVEPSPSPLEVSVEDFEAPTIDLSIAASGHRAEFSSVEVRLGISATGYRIDFEPRTVKLEISASGYGRFRKFDPDDIP